MNDTPKYFNNSTQKYFHNYAWKILDIETQKYLDIEAQKYFDIIFFVTKNQDGLFLWYIVKTGGLFIVVFSNSILCQADPAQAEKVDMVV